MKARRRCGWLLLIGLLLIVASLNHHPQAVLSQANGTTSPYRLFLPKLEVGSDVSIFDVLRIERVAAPVVLGGSQLNTSVGVRLRNTAEVSLMVQAPDCLAGGVNLWLMSDATTAGASIDEDQFINYLPIVLPECGITANAAVDVNIAFDVSELAIGDYLLRAEYVRSGDDGGAPIDTEATGLAVLPQSDRWSVVGTAAGPEPRSVVFVDAQTGWISANGGTIYHTKDGGVSWETQRSGFERQYLWDLDFVDQNYGWVSGTDASTSESTGVLLFTLDGGQTWQPAQGIQGCLFKNVVFVDHSHGWVIEEDCEHQSWIWRTSDGGQSWTRLDLPDPHLFAFLYDVEFVDSHHGWLATMGLGGGIIATDDGADSWMVQAEQYLYYTSIDFVSTTEGWIIGYGPFGPSQVCLSGFEVMLWHTIDAGENWDVEAFFCGEEGTTGSSGSVSLADIQHGMVSYWVKDVGEIVISTSDMGQGWTDWFEIDGMNGLQMVTPDIAYAIRDDGAVLKFER